MKEYVVNLAGSGIDTDTGIFCNSEVSPITDIIPEPYADTCRVEKHLVGVANMYEKFLGQYVISKGLPDMYGIVTTKGAKFYLFTFKNTKETRWLYDFLESYGIYTGNLIFGINFSTPTVYLTNKLMRDLSKFSPKMQASMLTTLWSVGYFLLHTEYTVGAKARKGCTVDSAGNVTINWTLSEVVASFKDIDSITVAELPVEDYTEVTHKNTSGCFAQDNTMFSTGDIPAVMQIGIDTDDNSRLILGFQYAGALRTVVCAVKKQYIFDSQPIALFDLTESSIYSALMHAENTKVVFCGPSIVLKNPENYNTIAITDYMEDPTSKSAFLNNICKVLEDKLADPTEAQMAAFTDYTGAILSSSSLSTTVSPEEIKASYKDDAYAAQLYAQRKTYYDTFDLGTLSANIPGFCNGNLYSLMFIGDSGTGKSTAARVLADKCGFPYASINFSINLEESDIIGSMIPNIERKEATEPEFIWQDGILTKAVRNGYCLILEELNFARPGVLGKLNSLLDENRQIDLPTGEIVKAHPNFRIIATLNVAYEGTNRLNKALINRFQDCTVFEVPDRSKLLEIIKTRCNYKNLKKIEPILTVFNAVQKFSKESNLELIVSVRQLLNVFNNGKYYTDANEAVHRIMLNGAFLEDPERKQEFEETIMSAIDLNYKL